MNDIYFSLSSFNKESVEQIINHPGEFFSAVEILEYERFKITKRQEEWIASRLTAKKLIRKVFRDETMKLTDILIKKDMTGQPYIWKDGYGRLGGNFSLSHSHNKVFCGYSEAIGTAFGLDIERVEMKSPVFVHDYFTQSELANYQKADWQDKAELATLTWSAKEACLKAISKGLSVDTRKVEIMASIDRSIISGWRECTAHYTSEICEEFKVHWQRSDEFIATICISKNIPVQLVEVPLD